MSAPTERGPYLTPWRGAGRGRFRRKRLLRAAAAAWLLGLAGSARAFPAIDFTAGFNSQTIPDRSFDLVSTSDLLNQFALSAAFQPVGRLPLWIELGYQYGNNGASLHEVGSADLDVHDITLTLIFRHRFLRYLTWLARAGPTLSVSRLAIENAGGATDAAQWRVVPGAEGTLGLEVPFFAQDADGLPDAEENIWRSVGVGMRVEAGYAWQPALAFDSLSGPNPGAIPSEPLALGGIELRGVIVRASLFVRY
jgi:hypothetical protein